MARKLFMTWLAVFCMMAMVTDAHALSLGSAVSAASGAAGGGGQREILIDPPDPALTDPARGAGVCNFVRFFCIKPPRMGFDGGSPSPAPDCVDRCDVACAWRVGWMHAKWNHEKNIMIAGSANKQLNGGSNPDAVSGGARKDLYDLMTWQTTVFYPTLMQYYSNGKVALPQFMTVEDFNNLVENLKPSWSEIPTTNITQSGITSENMARTDATSERNQRRNVIATLELVRRYAEILQSARVTEQQAYSNVIALMLLNSIADGNALITHSALTDNLREMDAISVIGQTGR